MSNQNSEPSSHSKHCPKCGSQELVLDGVTASWDTVSQQWVMGDDYEDVWCNNSEAECGWSGRLDQIQKEPL